MRIEVYEDTEKVTAFDTNLANNANVAEKGINSLNPAARYHDRPQGTGQRSDQ
jgi:hypothetical protein